MKTSPIKKTAPSATVGAMPLPSTRPNAVNAVSEIAQPIAIGSFAHKPINSEPKAVVRQTATNTALVSNPALPSMPGTTNTEYTIAKKVVTPATISRRSVLPRAEMSKYRSTAPLVPKPSVAPEPTIGRAWVSLMSLLLYQHAETAARTVIRVVSNPLCRVHWTVTKRRRTQNRVPSVGQHGAHVTALISA